jgi:hypothetical protein
MKTNIWQVHRLVDILHKPSINILYSVLDKACIFILLILFPYVLQDLHRYHILCMMRDHILIEVMSSYFWWPSLLCTWMVHSYLVKSLFFYFWVLYKYGLTIISRNEMGHDYFNTRTVNLLLFCTMTNKCTII